MNLGQELVGTVTDMDGVDLAVSVDGDCVVVGTSTRTREWRLNRHQRMALYRLLQDATIAASEHAGEAVKTGETT